MYQYKPLHVAGKWSTSGQAEKLCTVFLINYVQFSLLINAYLYHNYVSYSISFKEKSK